LMLIKSAPWRSAIAALVDRLLMITFGKITRSVRRWPTTQSTDQDDRGRKVPEDAPANRDVPDRRAIPDDPDLKVRAARPARRANLVGRANRDRKAVAASRARKASPASAANRVPAASYPQLSK